MAKIPLCLFFVSPTLNDPLFFQREGKIREALSILFLFPLENVRYKREFMDHFIFLKGLFSSSCLDSFLKLTSPNLFPILSNKLNLQFPERFVSSPGQQPFIMIMLADWIDTSFVGKQCYNLLYSLMKCIAFQGARFEQKFTSLHSQEIKGVFTH